MFGEVRCELEVLDSLHFMMPAASSSSSAFSSVISFSVVSVLHVREEPRRLSPTEMESRGVEWSYGSNLPSKDSWLALKEVVLSSLKRRGRWDSSFPAAKSPSSSEMDLS